MKNQALKRWIEDSNQDSSEFFSDSAQDYEFFGEYRVKAFDSGAQPANKLVKK